MHNHIKEVVILPKVPFRVNGLDLSIYVFDDQLPEQHSNKDLNDPSPKEENELKFMGDNMEDMSIELLGAQNVLRSNNREVRKTRYFEKRSIRRRGIMRVRKTLNNRERMAAKLTKRLSSSNSPLKRTRWNDGQ